MKPLPSSSGARPSSRSLLAASCCAAMSQRMHRARAKRSDAPLGVLAGRRARLGGLHDDRRGHPVGAHVHLDVLVRRAQRDARLGERAAGAHAERGDEVDDVRHLRKLGKLGPDLERDLRQPLRDELRQELDRLVDERRADEPAYAAGETRRSMGRATPSCASTYHPGLPSNHAPCAVVNLRGSPGRWNDDFTRTCVPSCDSSRSKRGAQRLVAEAELHHLRLDDDPPPLEQRQADRRVLAPHFDPHPARPFVLEPREHADRLAVGRRRLALHREEGARQERRARVRVEQGHDERSRRRPVPGGLHLEAVLDRLRHRRHRLGEPSVDARRNGPAAVRGVRSTCPPAEHGSPAAPQPVAVRPVRHLQRGPLPVPLPAPATLLPGPVHSHVRHSAHVCSTTHRLRRHSLHPRPRHRRLARSAR